MCVKDVVIQNQVGLHARPATFFIQKANEFRSTMMVEQLLRLLWTVLMKKRLSKVL